ncbi:MAG: hypothetical protein AAFR38_01690 [Planctomycetota bacterium]
MLLSYGGWEPEPWVDRLPRLLEPMGITSHRARSGREASEVIRATPIHVAIVDLGLPLDASESDVRRAAFAEGGIHLLSLLQRMGTTPPTVVVKRGKTTRDDQRELSAALRAGAFAVVDRPRESRDVELVLEVLRRLVTKHYEGRWPA